MPHRWRSRSRNAATSTAAVATATTVVGGHDVAGPRSEPPRLGAAASAAPCGTTAAATACTGTAAGAAEAAEEADGPGPSSCAARSPRRNHGRRGRRACARLRSLDRVLCTFDRAPAATAAVFESVPSAGATPHDRLRSMEPGNVWRGGQRAITTLAGRAPKMVEPTRTLPEPRRMASS